MIKYNFYCYDNAFIDIFITFDAVLVHFLTRNQVKLSTETGKTEYACIFLIEIIEIIEIIATFHNAHTVRQIQSVSPDTISIISIISIKNGHTL